MKHCQWCDQKFKTEIVYQIYCSPECRELSTREKIAARYMQSKRAKRKGKTRLCKSCSMPLSIYNDFAVCSSCSVNPDAVSKAIKKIKDKTDGKK